MAGVWHQPARGHVQVGVETGGSTNLSGGWLRGRELVAQNRLEHGVNRIILLTDGLANVGITNQQQLTGLAGQAKHEHITTTTIGFGTDYNEHLLRAMADAGGGNTYYIERVDQASAIFADELQGLLDLGAQNITVTIHPAEATQLVAVHHDYPSSRNGNVLRLELGDLYAREPKPVLAEFLMAGTDNPPDDATPVAVAELIVTGDVLLDDGRVEHQTITLPIMLTGTGANIEPDVRREMLLLETARARRDALELRERGDFSGAASIIASALDDLGEAGIDDDAIREEGQDRP